MKTIEIAAQGSHGEWDLVGDYPSRGEALLAAMVMADTLHHDDSGMVVLGLSDDPGSGHYEDRVGLVLDSDGSHDMIDPLP